MTRWAALASAAAATPVDEACTVERLNADLLASHSATLTLERWSAALGLAEPPTVYAEVDRTASVPSTPLAVRQRLGVGDLAELRYRRVRLKCGPHVLSDAANWYVPARLTVEMNAALATTDAPFGRVILPLSPVRRNLSAQLLRGKAGYLDGPVLRHRALVTDWAGRPLAEVIENYLAVLLPA